MDEAIIKMNKIFTGDEIKPVKNEKKAKNIIIDNEESDDGNVISILFKDKVIREEIELKDTKNFEIPIKIENNGNKTYEKLYFIKDEKDSSKDINILSNKKNVHTLTMTGNFLSSVEETHILHLSIDNPKPNQEYTLYLYVTEDLKGKSLSKKLKIVLKVKEEKVEDPKEKQKEEAMILYSEYADKYNLSIIIKKEEIIQKFIELENKKESINKWIEDEFDKKANELYDALNMTDVVDENEAKNKISELKYDQEKIKEWLQSKIRK